MGWQGIDIFTPIDLLFSILVLLFLYLHASIYSKKYDGQNKQQYFIPALHVRMIGCFLSVMMYQYYYHGGDMFGYYSAVNTMSEVFWDNPALGIKMLTARPETLPPETLYACWTSMGSYAFRAYNSLLLCQIATVIGLITFNNCLATGFILAYFSFIGCWKLYEIFEDLYPHLEKYLAWATLFVPSVFFWGAAGLMKDTLTMAAVGYFTWSAYHLFFKGQKIIKSISFMAISFFIMINIKSYIAIAFLPALMAWLVLSYQQKIKSPGMRMLVKPILIIGAIIVSLGLFSGIAGGEAKYSPDGIVDYAMVMQQDHARLGGSTYSLGTIDPSPMGMLRMAPLAIIVTLFRPYLWEASSPVLLISALEGFFTLLTTLYVFSKTGVFKTIGTILNEPTVLFCMIYALVFSFAVGFSAYNFGALARYKIPALPFYYVALVILLDKAGVFQKEDLATNG